MEPPRRIRKQQRLPFYDYRSGWFFVTICTAHRASRFGAIQDGRLLPTDLGRLVSSCWDDIALLHDGCVVDDFALMPDHLHGILSLTKAASVHVNRTLGSVLGSFKSSVTKLARAQDLLDRSELWQRGFFERVIRDERELQATRRYIRENALAIGLPPRITIR
jgi:REP element-mobilizing transposase RayT